MAANDNERTSEPELDDADGDGEVVVVCLILDW